MAGILTFDVCIFHNSVNTSRMLRLAKILTFMVFISLSMSDKSIKGDHYSLVFSDIIYRNQNHHVIITKSTGTPYLYISLSVRSTISSLEWTKSASVMTTGESIGDFSFLVNSSFPEDRALVSVSVVWSGTAVNCSDDHSVILLVSEQPFPFLVVVEKRVLQPGEIAHFRAINVFHHVLYTIPMIFLENNNGRRVEGWKNVSQNEALRGFVYQIPEEGSVGRWKICVFAESTLQYEYLIVQRNKSPLSYLDVLLFPPPYLRLDAIVAKYKVCINSKTLILSGKLKTSLCITPGSVCAHSTMNDVNLNNCSTFQVSTANLKLRNISHSRNENLFLTVQIKENVSGKTMTVSQVGGPLVNKPFNLFIEAPSVYQPGLPFIGVVRAVDLDKKPAKDLDLLLIAPELPLVHHKILTTDEQGEAHLKLPPFSIQRETVKIIIRSVKHSLLSMHPNMIQPKAQLTLSRKSSAGAYMLAEGICKGDKLFVKFRTTVPLYNTVVNAIVVSQDKIKTAEELGVGVKEPICEDTNDPAFGHYFCREKRNGQQLIKCRSGWRGYNCLSPICSRGCVRGICAAPDTCRCHVGWLGEACNICSQRRGCQNGYCHAGNDCNCLAGWTGFLCNIQNTSSPSSNLQVITSLPIPPLRPLPSRERLLIFIRNEEMNIEPYFGRNPHFVFWFRLKNKNLTETVYSEFQLTPSRCNSLISSPTLIASKTQVRPKQPFNVTINDKDSICSLFSSKRIIKSSIFSENFFTLLAQKRADDLRIRRCASPSSIIIFSSRGRQTLRLKSFNPTNPQILRFQSYHEPPLWKFQFGMVYQNSSAVIVPQESSDEWHIGALCLSSKFGPLIASSVKVNIVPDDITFNIGLPHSLQQYSNLTVPLILLLRTPKCFSLRIRILPIPSITHGISANVFLCKSEIFQLHLKPRKPGIFILNGYVKYKRMKVNRRWYLKIRPIPDSVHKSKQCRYKCQNEGTHQATIVTIARKSRWNISSLLLSGDMLGFHPLLYQATYTHGSTEVVLGSMALAAQLRQQLNSDGRYRFRFTLLKRLPIRIKQMWMVLKKKQGVDGGFSSIQNTSKNHQHSSIWMTAVSAKSLWLCMDILNDSFALSQTLKFLSVMQNSTNGCFSETNAVYGYWFGGGLTQRHSDHSIALTAAVLEEVKDIPTANKIVSLGHRCLLVQTKLSSSKGWNIHTLALVTNQMVLWKPNNNSTIALLKELRRRNTVDKNGEIFWMTKPIRKTSSDSFLNRWRLNMFEEETSGIALLAQMRQMISTKRFENSLHVMTLGVAKLAKGRWFSMTDKMASFKAVDVFFKLSREINLALSVDMLLYNGSTIKHKVLFDSWWTRDFSYIKEFKNLRSISFKMSGLGCALVCVNTIYVDKDP